MKAGLVKICGLTDPGNILEVIRLRPDFIGLIFHPGSPRYISDPEELVFLNKLHERPLVTGVFVNSDIARIREISNRIRLDVIQLHGTETPEYCEELKNCNQMVIKAFGIRPGFDFQETEPYRGLVRYFLFDSDSPKFGGTGQPFDHEILKNYQGDTPFLLSGGISSETQIFPDHRQFAGVDLNSRFETAPGIKDIELLQTFLKNFRHE